jgi:DNA-binding CsgD family transcriptional regulator
MKSGLEKLLNVWEARNKILKPVKKELYLELIEQVAHLFAAGSFYYFIFNFHSKEIEVVHEGTKAVLGLDPKELTLGKLTDIMLEEDQAKIHEKEMTAGNFLFNTIPPEDIPLYKVVYLIRLQHADGTYKTILHQSKTIVSTEDGKIQQVLVIHTDVTYLNIPFDHKVSFISNKRPSYYALKTGFDFIPIEENCSKHLSQREKEIVKKLSEGKNFNEIAASLFLSPHTINTHKRNILKKVGCKNTTELVARCIREGII